MKYLRKLERRDAPLMLEWMHDPAVTANLRKSFEEMTLSDAEAFIANSYTETDQHFAVVDAYDEYMGTISLKQISRTDKNAEYAISTRRCAHGTGIAMEATKELLTYAFTELSLHKVYLNVLKCNARANRFYQKCGFAFEGTAKEQLLIKGRFFDLNWYAIINEG